MEQSYKKQEINLLVPDILKMINWSGLFCLCFSYDFTAKQGVGQEGNADRDGNILGLLLMNSKSTATYSV